MSKRIFTKQFNGQVMIVNPGSHVANAVQSWLAQEAIQVIGAEIVIQSSLPSENDGKACGAIELSQVGIKEQDGAILSAFASEWWNTAPAGITDVNGHAVVMFPEGSAIPVKEEGYLYINESGIGKSAGASVFDWRCYVYYTKGSK